METDPSKQKRGGKEGLVKLEERLLVRCQKEREQLDSDSCAHLERTKAFLVRRRIDLARFYGQKYKEHEYLELEGVGRHDKHSPCCG